MGENDNGMHFHCFLFCAYKWSTQRLHSSNKRTPPRRSSITLHFFFLCAEGLSAMVLWAQQENKIQDINVARGAPAISHIFFADDSILFCQATKEACDALQEILDTYEAASGQQVNKEKTNIFFSKNTRTEMKEWIKSKLGSTRH